MARLTAAQKAANAAAVAQTVNGETAAPEMAALAAPASGMVVVAAWAVQAALNLLANLPAGQATQLNPEDPTTRVHVFQILPALMAAESAS